MQRGGGLAFMLGNACSRLPQPAAAAAASKRSAQCSKPGGRAGTGASIETRSRPMSPLTSEVALI